MSQNITQHKIVLLGESTVGKSSILTRLTKDTFSEITVSTITEFFTEKEIKIKGESIKFQIWDTAGQEKFRSIAKNYYIGCVGAILVYDITQRETFKEIMEYWYKEIIQYNPTIGMYK